MGSARRARGVGMVIRNDEPDDFAPTIDDQLEVISKTIDSIQELLIPDVHTLVDDFREMVEHHNTVHKDCTLMGD